MDLYILWVVILTLRQTVVTLFRMDLWIKDGKLVIKTTYGEWLVRSGPSRAILAFENIIKRSLE